MISESEGCALLEKTFKQRGYAIKRGVDFHEGAVHCQLDGWDASQRVGFEYLVRAEGDHDDLTGQELAELGGRMERGELHVLIVDEATDARVLGFAALRFLDEVERRRGAPHATRAPTLRKAKAGARAHPQTRAAPKKTRLRATKKKKVAKKKQRR